MPRDWNRHYSDGESLDETPDSLLVQAMESIAPGEALDLACGPGRNAIYLARLGWKVTAVDNSAVAMAILRERAVGLPVTVVESDLESREFAIAPNAYDLICDFHYLHRPLFPEIRKGIRPGGLFVAAVHMVDPEASTGPHDPAFLLEPGELRRQFAGWKIAFYSEAAEAPGKRRVARILARRA
jgi:tellurite methyltransferase